MPSTGNRKKDDPVREIRVADIEKWASQGVPRKQMARKAKVSYGYLNQSIKNSRELILAELRGKIKFYE